MLLAQVVDEAFVEVVQGLFPGEAQGVSVVLWNLNLCQRL